MRIITNTDEMKAWSAKRLAEGASIGFVPTMGYLHAGHVSLIEQCAKENDKSVVSVFVNPTQFGPGEDLAVYPRDPDADAAKCAAAGVNVLYMPDNDEIYAPDHRTYVVVEGLSEPLCGASRPGHFRGVATVVLKLFNIVKPTRAYFGRKDYQQLRVIKTMTADLNVDTQVIGCPIVREPDGLAMSSRNAYLSPSERQAAVCLYGALLAAKSLFDTGETQADAYRKVMTDRIALCAEANPDYIRLVDPVTLEDLDHVDNEAVAALAVRIGSTRLIDNMVFKRPDDCERGACR